jgi:hypothetical protein
MDLYHKWLHIGTVASGLAGLELGGFLFVDQIAKDVYAHDPLRYVCDANDDGKVDFYYPALKSWAIRRDDGRFDICDLVPSGGQGVLATRDRKNTYLPLGKNGNQFQ